MCFTVSCLFQQTGDEFQRKMDTTRVDVDDVVNQLIEGSVICTILRVIMKTNCFLMYDLTDRLINQIID